MAKTNNDAVTREELFELGYKWFSQQVESSKDHFPQLFDEVDLSDYLTLHALNSSLKLHESKVYLKDIAKELDLPMKRISPRVQKMQDRGLVTWKHDSKGTFITISDEGQSSMEKQQDKLADFIEKCVSRYGYDKLVTLVQHRSEFNDIMHSVLTELREEKSAKGSET